MRKKLYVAVNPDGSEVCSNKRLFRYADALKSLIEQNSSYTMYADRENAWCDDYSQGYFSVPKFSGVYLPKCSIQNIIGRKLTWEDEPEVIDI